MDEPVSVWKFITEFWLAVGIPVAVVLAAFAFVEWWTCSVFGHWRQRRYRLHCRSCGDLLQQVRR